MIQVKSFFAHNELRNFSYIIFDDSTGKAWVLDPYDATPMIKYIKKNSLSLQGILNTHQHFDHIRGNAPLIEAFHCEEKKFYNADKIVLDQDFELETLDTPGHTPDHQVFVLREKGLSRGLFSGDTLFNSGVGNCRSGNVDQLFETTKKLLSYLPGETILYPGHDYAIKNLQFARKLEPENSAVDTELKAALSNDPDHPQLKTLAEEKKYNPFLRLQSEEIRQNLMNKVNLLEHADQYERDLFHKMRSLRDQW